MSLRALRTLIAISRKGSFVAASDQLGLTQAAVSLQVKNLEEDLGAPLFNRDGHKPKLNASGRLVVERAEQIIGLYDGLKDELNPSGSIDGELFLGAIPTVVSGPLPAVLAGLKEEYPLLKIRLFCSLSAELARKVEEDELDGALITEPISSIMPSCQWTEYDTEYFYIVAPKGTPVLSEEGLFQKFPFIRFDRTAWAGTIVDDYLLKKGINAQEVMEFNSCEAALSMVAQGLGITVVSFNEQRLEDATGHYTFIPFGSPQLFRRIGLYQKRQHPRQRFLNLFFDTMLGTKYP